MIKRFVSVIAISVPIALVVNYILCGLNPYTGLVFGFLIAWVIGDLYEVFVKNPDGVV